MLAKIAKAVLWLLALVLLAALCWGLAYWFEWPGWVAVLLFLAVIGLLLGVKFFRRLYDRFAPGRRAGAALKEGEKPKPPTAAENLSHLHAQWKRALATLRGSNLRARGNPVYALPWYLALGRAGSGKTIALARAGLVSAIQESVPGRTGPETRTCEWFFFERSVVIDASGRYVARDQDDDTRGEWRSLLALISRYRRREPLNGLIMAVPADWLLFANRDAIAEEGRFIRSRVDQLMRLLDTRFPVYVLVTKCDVLYGMDDWARHLPEATLHQAMGYAGAGDMSDPAQFIKDAFDSVADRLRDLRLLLTREVEAVTPAALLFPNEFERMRPPLETFFRAAFGTDPYLETPFLRGLFFSSGAQRGGVSSYVLKDTGLPEQTALLSGSMRSLFLHDPLGRIIPDDRKLHRPLGHALEWRRITRNLGLSAWLLLGVVAAVGLTIAFTDTFDTVSQLRERYPGAKQRSGKFAEDLAELSSLHDAIHFMDERNRRWFVAWAPFSRNAEALEQHLRDSFARRFGEVMDQELDPAISQRIKPMAEREPDAVTARYIQFIVRRINLVKARHEHNEKLLESLPPPTRSGHTLQQVQGDLSDEAIISPQAAGNFGPMYKEWLRRIPDDSVAHELHVLTSWLNQIALNRPDLQWLRVWANEQTFVKPLRLGKFWDGSLKLEEPVEVEGAFTAEGSEAIAKFLKEVQATGGGSGFAEKRQAFEQWYREQRRKAWLAFVLEFDSGLATLDGPQEWRPVMQRLGTEGDPYLALIRRLASEFKDAADLAATPQWLSVVRSLDAARTLAERENLLAKVPAIVSGAGRQAIRGTIEAGPAAGIAVVDKQLKAGKAFGEYHSQLQKALSEAIASRGQAVKLASETFAYAADPQAKPTALHDAQKALAEMQSLVGGTDFDSRAVWTLMQGPLRFVVQFTVREAGCAVQQDWEAKVLAPAKGALSESALADMLYGEKGSVWAFAEGTAKPFLARDASRFFPVEAMGTNLPFEAGVIQVLDRAVLRRQQQAASKEAQKLAEERAKLEEEQRRSVEERKREEAARSKQQAQDRVKEVDAELASLKPAIDVLRSAAVAVTVSGLPTSVTPGAAAFPHATVLRVQCGDAQRTIANYNYPVSNSFTWSATTCGDTILDIQFDRFTLTRKYPGPTGFAEFLRQFRDGRASFRPGDFPGQRQALEQLGIANIDVQYEFSGQETILRKQAELAELQRQERQKQDERRQFAAQLERADRTAFDEKQQDLRERAEDLRLRSAGLAKREAQLTAGPQEAELLLPGKAAACWERPVQMARARAVPAAGAEPAPAGGDYAVQVGLFGPDNARHVLETLKGAGYTPSTQQVEGRSGILLKVRVGPFPTAEAADAASQEINRLLSLDDSLVVKMLEAQAGSAANR